MKTAVLDAWRMIVPLPNDRHGPLSPLLLSLTFLTGLVDAFSYLVLGHVFVANMTGNVVFLAFALAGAKGFSLPTLILALVAFSLGAFAGGRLITKLRSHRGHLLTVASACASPRRVQAIRAHLSAGRPATYRVPRPTPHLRHAAA